MIKLDIILKKSDDRVLFILTFILYNFKGLNHALLQVKFTPNMVHGGIGLTLDDAINNAALNCLLLIRAVCAKPNGSEI